MSLYAYLLCHDCKQIFFLGKAIHSGPENYRPFFFHLGNEEPPNWKREELNQVVWKFLADHTGHQIQVLPEHDMTEEMWEYRGLDGGLDTNIPRYLEGWKGLEKKEHDTNK